MEFEDKHIIKFVVAFNSLKVQTKYIKSIITSLISSHKIFKIK